MQRFSFEVNNVPDFVSQEDLRSFTESQVNENFNNYSYFEILPGRNQGEYRVNIYIFSRDIDTVIGSYFRNQKRQASKS